MEKMAISRNYGLKICLWYLFVAGGWILFSDWILAQLVSQNALLTQIQTYKGIFFVLVTSALLYFLVNRYTETLRNSRNTLGQLVNQKQVLISELHHRVKNNLAIVTGLMELQAYELDEESSHILKETQYRIFTLARIQELLYQQGDLANIPFHDFVHNLLSSIDFRHEHTIHSEIEELLLNVNQAVPLGLLINELMSPVRANTHDHAIESIRLILRKTGKNSVYFEISLQNPESGIISRLKDSKKIQSTLIKLYSKQLGGKATWENSNKMLYKLEFQREQGKGPLHRFSDSVV